MKQAHRNWILTLLLAILFSTGQAQETLPYIADGLLDSTHIETLGLKASPAVTTVTIFSPTDETMHYANGVVMTAFKNTLFCMWQCSQTDEDAPETSVVMSKSTDEGHTWSSPVVIAAANDSCYYTSGGWISTTDTLVAFINTWPKRGYFTGHDRGKQSRELEPSLYQRHDSTLVMIFRDQAGSYGCCFDKAILLRAGSSDLQPQRYPGKAKTLGYSYPKSMVHHGKLYIAYATNKEDVEYTTVDLNTLESLNSSADNLN